MNWIGYVVILVLLGGAGLWMWQKDVEEKRAERAMEYRRMEEKKEAEDRQRTAMKTFAEEMRKHRADGKKAAEQALKTLRADSAKFSETVSKIMAEKNEKGEDQKYETKILHVLKDADVNALAQKYLGSDFAGVTAEYMARVREAYDEAKKTSRTQAGQRKAADNRRNAGADRRLKPKTSLVDIVSDVESKTVGQIRKVLTNKIDENEKTVKELTDKIAAVDEFLLEVPAADLHELARRKAKLDK